MSNLPFISKLTENASVNQLSGHMNKVRSLPSGQSAYRPFHSTETALLKVQSDILLNMDDQKVTLLVMLDLSTAFDTIDHIILWETLGSGFGVGGTALKWFTSYLSQRTQQIQIKGTLSEKKQLTTGVPQGSCLGPVLLTIYVADLFQIIEKHLPEAQGYADDHQVYLSFRPIPSTNQTASVTAIENCVAELRSWMISNMLMVNDSKTEFLIVGSKQQLERVNIPFIHVGEDQITPVMSVRNLGVIFDSNLKMDMQITKACQNAFYHLHNIRRIRKFLSQEATCTIIHALITNQIDYCNSFDEWTTRESHQETPACAKHSCQTSFQSEEIWSHNSCTRYASLASRQIPDWIQNTVDRLQRTSWQGTYLHPRNDHPIKKQKIFHKIQWRTCPEGSKIQAWYFR